MVQKIVIATGNKGKVFEIEAILTRYFNHAVELIPQAALHVPEAEETGSTFEENALIKARHAAMYSGLPAIADDSGLVVDALGGAPGIYSARYAGPNATAQDNIDKLMYALTGVPLGERSAHFYCAIAYVRTVNDPHPVISQAMWQGEIVEVATGKAGFGYDPIFYLSEYGCTAAELEPAVKQQVSHRGKALTQMLRTRSNCSFTAARFK